MKWAWAHRATVAFIGFVVVLAFMFTQQRSLIRRVDSDARNRSHVACLERNKGKTAVHQFARRLVAIRPPHPSSQDIPFLQVTDRSFPIERCVKP